jgi:hypothetical protein
MSKGAPLPLGCGALHGTRNLLCTRHEPGWHIATGTRGIPEYARWPREQETPAHRRDDELLINVEHAAQDRAGLLADQMNDWLTTEAVANPIDGADSDLVEWCRSARDLLEEVARA